MFTVSITHTRPSEEILFFWETDLINHTAYQEKVERYYSNNITIGERIYSTDKLNTSQSFTTDSSDTYYDCKRIADADPELIEYWLERDNYNFDNNIFRVIQEEQA